MKRKPIVIIIAMMFAFASILQFGTYLFASAEELPDGADQPTENEIIDHKVDLNETEGIDKTVENAEDKSDSSKLINNESEQDTNDLEISESDNPKPVSGGPAVIKIWDTEYPDLKSAVEAAQEGDILTAVADEILLTENITIPAEKKLTLDLSGKTMIIAQDKSYSRIISVSTSNPAAQGAFTLKNGKVTSRDGDGDGYTSSLIYAKNSNIDMNNVEAFNVKTNVSGSILYLEANKNITLNINNCNFHDNRASENGGTLKISIGNKDAEGSEINIKNNKFTNNRAEALGQVIRASFGGAISLSGPGKYLIKGNEIIGNEAFAKNEYSSGIYYSCGGGISLGGTLNTHGCEDVTLEDNIISKNKAQLFGGGVFCQMEKKNDKLAIKSGLFSYNESGYSGGGLDLSPHNQPFLVMDNVLMTGNKAPTGAGIWACPTARVRNHSTFGAAIIGNILDQREKTKYKISGTDVRFEGSDTIYRSIAEHNNPNYHKVSIQDRTFLGNKVDWYADEPGALYKDGDLPLTPDKYTGRSTSFGLYGKMLGDEGYENHKKYSKIIFIGNIAKERGGAIATNTDIDFGQENLEVNVKVTKAWKDEKGQKLTKDIPKEVSVKLIREDSDGGKYDLETIKLNDENNWTHVFKNLPSKGILEDKEVDFSYTIEEVNAPKGYVAEIKTLEATEEAQYEFLLENQKKPPEPKNPPEPKAPETGDNDSANILYVSAIIFSLLIINKILNKNKMKTN